MLLELMSSGMSHDDILADYEDLLRRLGYRATVTVSHA